MVISKKLKGKSKKTLRMVHTTFYFKLLPFYLLVKVSGLLKD